jgi:hypothetical protein
MFIDRWLRTAIIKALHAETSAGTYFSKDLKFTQPSHKTSRELVTDSKHLITPKLR